MQTVRRDLGEVVSDLRLVDYLPAPWVEVEAGAWRVYAIAIHGYSSAYDLRLHFHLGGRSSSACRKVWLDDAVDATFEKAHPERRGSPFVCQRCLRIYAEG